MAGKSRSFAALKMTLVFLDNTGFLDDTGVFTGIGQVSYRVCRSYRFAILI